MKQDSFWPNTLWAFSECYILWSHYCSTPVGTSLFSLLGPSQCYLPGLHPALLSQLSDSGFASLPGSFSSLVMGTWAMSHSVIEVFYLPRSLDPDSSQGLYLVFLGLLPILTSLLPPLSCTLPILLLFSLVFHCVVLFTWYFQFSKRKVKISSKRNK